MLTAMWEVRQSSCSQKEHLRSPQSPMVIPTCLDQEEWIKAQSQAVLGSLLGQGQDNCSRRQYHAFQVNTNMNVGTTIWVSGPRMLGPSALKAVSLGASEGQSCPPSRMNAGSSHTTAQKRTLSCLGGWNDVMYLSIYHGPIACLATVVAHTNASLSPGM